MLLTVWSTTLLDHDVDDLLASSERLLLVLHELGEELTDNHTDSTPDVFVDNFTDILWRCCQQHWWQSYLQSHWGDCWCLHSEVGDTTTNKITNKTTNKTSWVVVNETFNEVVVGSSARSLLMLLITLPTVSLEGFNRTLSRVIWQVIVNSLSTHHHRQSQWQSHWRHCW